MASRLSLALFNHRLARCLRFPHIEMRPMTGELVALRCHVVIYALSFALALVSTSWPAKMTDVTTRTLQHWRHVAKYVMLVLIASRTCVRLLSLLHPNLDHMLTPASR